MTQVSYYISVNRGYNFLGFAIGVFIQLPIIYQLIFFYEANTQQYSIILFGIPIAAAIFQGIITLNYAKTLAEKEQKRDQVKDEIEAQRTSILKQILTDEARQRLTNIRIVRPEFADTVELQLIQLAQTGRLGEKITDTQLKKTLQQISQRKRESKISFR